MSAQNIWYGLSLGSVLLLAAIGLAITFGVMGVINMAHGEMVMLGAYTTFVVQQVIRTYAPGLFDWSLVIALPLAFLFTGARRRRHRARHHPLALRPAARNAARHLGPVADPAAGGAHRSSGRTTGRSAIPTWMSGAFDARRPRRSPGTGCGSWSSRSWSSPRCSCVLNRTPLRPADARRHAEPPHGLVDGHPHAVRRRA